MTLPLGFILDRYGSFIARSLCTTLMTLGLLLLMFTVEVNWFMFPGIALFTSGTVFNFEQVKNIYLGSFALLVTNHPLSQLFPKATAFIVVLGTCVFQGSNSVFRLWQLLFDGSIPFKTIVGINLAFTLD